MVVERIQVIGIWSWCDVEIVGDVAWSAEMWQEVIVFDEVDGGAQPCMAVEEEVDWDETWMGAFDVRSGCGSLRGVGQVVVHVRACAGSTGC